MNLRYPTRVSYDALIRLSGLVLASQKAGYLLPADELFDEGWTMTWKYPSIVCMGAPLAVEVAVDDDHWREHKEDYFDALTALSIVPCVSKVRFVRPCANRRGTASRPRLRFVLQVLEPSQIELWFYQQVVAFGEAWRG